LLDSIAVSNEVLRLEELTIKEQIAKMRQCSVLIGMHGAGLTNSIFMHKQSVLVQIMPKGTRGTGYVYKQFALLGDHKYLEWENLEEKWATIPWELLELTENAEKMQILNITRESLQKTGIPHNLYNKPHYEHLYWAFWLKQDTFIPTKTFNALLYSALQRGIHQDMEIESASRFIQIEASNTVAVSAYRRTSEADVEVSVVSTGVVYQRAYMRFSLNNVKVFKDMHIYLPC
jgi:hypothetical protein